MQTNQSIEVDKRKVTPPERFFSRSPFSIVTLVARIKGKISVDMLNNAVNKVQQRHFLLRSVIKEDDDHTQWFIPAGDQELKVEIVPRRSDQDWITIHAEALKVPFEFETRPAIRFILVQSDEISELIILCHHIICDGMSLAYLARDLMQYLGDPSLEVQEIPAPPIDLENLPADVSQSFVVKYFINRMNRKWQQDKEYFDSEDYRILTKAYWDNFDHAIILVELSEEQTGELVERCRRQKTTVNSALTAAFCGAQSFVEGEQYYHPKLVVAADLRERLPKNPGEAMGMYAGGAELNFKYNHQRPFWDNARDFNQKIQPKYTNKSLFSNINNWLYLDPTILDAIPFKELGGLVPPESPRYEKLSSFRQQDDVVLRILKGDNLDSLDKKLWGTAITNLGRLDFPENFGSLTLERLILQPGGGFPLANVNLVIGAATCSGKLSLVIEFAEQAVDAATVEKIKEKAMQYLLSE